EPAREARTTKDEHEAMLFHRLDEELDAGQPDVTQPIGEPDADLGRDASRAPIGDQSLAVDRAEVAARRDVAGAERELDSERLEHAAADLEHHRVVAEEPEVPRATAGRDAGRDVAEQAAHAVGRERGQVGNPRGPELRASRLGAREPAEAVEGK